MSALRESNAAVAAEHATVCHKYDQVYAACGSNTEGLHRLKSDVQFVQDQFDDLKDVFKYGTRITKMEDENRGLRNLIQ